eukprot:9496172-Pyramimonas_sp.AAC.1
MSAARAHDRCALEHQLCHCLNFDDYDVKRKPAAAAAAASAPSDGERSGGEVDTAPSTSKPSTSSNLHTNEGKPVSSTSTNASLYTGVFWNKPRGKWCAKK